MSSVIPFPQDRAGKRRTDLSGPCIIMVLPVIRIERHIVTDDDLIECASLLSDDTVDTVALHFQALRDTLGYQ